MNANRYLDLVSNKMVIKTPNARSSQVWYFDRKSKSIKSRESTAKSFDIISSGKSNQMQVYNTNGKWW